MSSDLTPSAADESSLSPLQAQLLAAQAELAALGSAVPRPVARRDRRRVPRRARSRRHAGGLAPERGSPAVANVPEEAAASTSSVEGVPQGETPELAVGLPASAAERVAARVSAVDERLERLERALEDRSQAADLSSLERVLERLSERLTSIEDSLSRPQKLPAPVEDQAERQPPEPAAASAALPLAEELELLPLEPEAAEAYLAPGELSVPTLAELEEELGLFHTDLAKQVFSEVGPDLPEVLSESARGRASLPSLASVPTPSLSAPSAASGVEAVDDAALLFDVSQASDDWSGAGWEGAVDGASVGAEASSSEASPLGAAGGSPLAPSSPRAPIRARPDPSWIATRKSLSAADVDYSIPEALSEIEDPNAARAALLSAPVLSDSEPWAARQASEPVDQLAPPSSEAGSASSVPSVAQESSPRSRRARPRGRRGRAARSAEASPDLSRLLALADGLARTGSDDARSLYEQVLQRDPGNERAQAGCIELLIAGQEHTEARVLLAHALEARPESASLLAARGRLHRSEGSWAQAHADLHRAWELEPSSVREEELAALEKRLGPDYWS